MVTLFKFIVVPSVLVGLIAAGLVASNPGKPAQIPIAHASRLQPGATAMCDSDSCCRMPAGHAVNAPGMAMNQEGPTFATSVADIPARCTGGSMAESHGATSAKTETVSVAGPNSLDQPGTVDSSRRSIASLDEAKPLPAELTPQQQEQFAEILKLRERFGGISNVFEDPGWVQRANAQFVLALQDEHKRDDGVSTPDHRIQVPEAAHQPGLPPGPSGPIQENLGDSQANRPMVLPNPPMVPQPTPPSAANAMYRGHGMSQPPTNGSPDQPNWRTEVMFAPGMTWQPSPRNMSPQQRARDYARRLDEIANQMEDDSLFESADDLRAISQSLRESARRPDHGRVQGNSGDGNHRHEESHEQNGGLPHHPPAVNGEDAARGP